MKIDFNDRVALVTGATRGIGGRIADDLLDLGATLILTGGSEEGVEKKRASLTAKEREKVTLIQADFTDPRSVERLLERIEGVERIDVCVNNAGINRINPIDETRLEDWDDIHAVNLKAPFMIIREISRTMKRNGYGRIINIASVFGHISREKRAVYSSTKFGLRGLTAAVSNELARFGVLVNAVSPGFVLTELTRSILSEEEMAELARQVPAGRLAMPEEISRVVLFLASSLNTYITGQSIIVDGGYVNV
ncbi:MAG: SDR family oxidoreductase [Desulfobacterales bacterium]|nr:SDR family oxidoreductase [Desulfobacterales bacterium]